MGALRSGARRDGDGGARELRREVDDRRALVLVHGYNTPRPDAVGAFQHVAREVHRRAPRAYDRIVGFTWPSGHSRYAYPWAKQRVPRAARRLRRWIDLLHARSRALDLFGYSLGTSVGRCALQELSSVRLRYIFAVAPALGVSLVQQALRERTKPHSYEHLYAFYSQNDVTLGRWFWLMEGEPALGYSIPEAVHDQLQALDVTPINFDHAVSCHTEYATSDALYDRIAGIVRELPSEPTGAGIGDAPLDHETATSAM